ncbi:hypothetical protein FB451DRAFT_1187510 [Mycena latifolia]|nr:hypothetical protein FB451DRAFT_1187510 [Mycena latifolia]
MALTETLGEVALEYGVKDESYRHRKFANRQGISEQALRGQNPVRHGVHDDGLTQKLARWDTEMFEKAQLHNPAVTASLLGGQLLKENYPAAFSDNKLDVLLLPCTPTISNYTLSVSDSVMVKMGKVVGIALNTAGFDVSGHPAISIPIGMLGVVEAGREADKHVKLPVGMQIAAGPWQESKIYRVALAFENSYDWHVL